MTKAPAFQFYAADYLADENVALMTLEEEGAYIRALAFAWREGTIPADPVLLGRLLKGASTTVVTTVRNCFVIASTDATRMVHPRLEEERRKQAEWREKSTIGGKASGKSRRNRGLLDEPNMKGGSTTLPNMVEPNANTSSSSSYSNKTTPPTPSLPEWISREAWNGFVEMRRRIKAPLTGRGAAGIFAKLARLRASGQDPNACLDQSTELAWRGVFELRSGSHGTAPRKPPSEGIVRARQPVNGLTEVFWNRYGPGTRYDPAEMVRRARDDGFFASETVTPEEVQAEIQRWLDTRAQIDRKGRP